MKKIILFISLSIGISSRFYAQSPVSVVTIPSATVSSLFQMTETPVSLHTGRADITIPIYEFKENNIVVPVYLSYNSSGVKPDVHPGWVGQNWSLQAGGAITRIVKGIPDEMGWDDIFQFFDNTGKKYADRKRPGYYYHTNRNGNANWDSYDTIVYRAKAENWKETEPDEFLFNINGQTGKFYFGHDKKIHVQSAPDIKVELDPVLILLPQSTYVVHHAIGSIDAFHEIKSCQFAGFKITMPDGMIYEFGYYGITPTDDPYVVESTVDFFHQLFDGEVFNTWYLRRIVSPDGDIVTFYYRPGFTYVYDGTVLDHTTAAFSRSMAFEKTSATASPTGLFSWMSSLEKSRISSHDEFDGKIQYIYYLNRIESKSKFIDFSITPTEELLYDHASIGESLQQRVQSYTPNAFGESPRKSISYLPNITDGYGVVNRSDLSFFTWRTNSFAVDIGDSDSPIKFIDNSFAIAEFLDFYRLKWFKLDWIKLFDKSLAQWTHIWNFKYNNKSNERLMLLSFKKMGENPYFFEYEDYYGTSKYDGDYKLPPYNSYLLDHWGYYNNTNSQITSLNDISKLGDDYYQKRETNPDYLYTGQLNRIIYPTGGYAEFTFEPHKYTRVVQRDESTGAFSLVPNAEKVAGGLRIKSIKYHDGKQFSMEKTYTYSNGILSRGIRYLWDNYKGRLQSNPSATYTSIRFVSQNLLPLSGGEDNHVTYSSVTETLSGNGKIEYQYSNYDTNSDENFINNIDDKKSLYTPYTSKGFERGKLASKTYYDQQGYKTRQEQYTYNKNVLPAVQSIRAVNTRQVPVFDGWAIEGTSYQMDIYPYNLTKKTDIAYGTNQSSQVSTDQTYSYNSYNLLTQKSESKSNSELITEKYKYPVDYSNDNTLVSMVNRHMITPVVEKNTYTGPNGGTQKLIASEYNQFKQFYPGVFQLEELRRLESISPVTAGNSYASLMKPYAQYHYNIHGRVSMVKPADGPQTVYLWGYSSQYPIARVENASPEEVRNALYLSESQISELEDQLAPSDEDFEKLRALRTRLPGALVFVYTYMPTIGITSETDPSGQTIYYEYEQGRLKLIRDHEGKIIEHYKYRYVNNRQNQ